MHGFQIEKLKWQLEFQVRATKNAQEFEREQRQKKVSFTSSATIVGAGGLPQQPKAILKRFVC